MAEFRSAPLMEVIEPSFAYTFLHHSFTRIDAFVKRTVEAEDLVFRTAFQELESFASPTARALTIYLAVKSVTTGATRFEQDQLLSSQTLHFIYSELREKQALLLETPSKRNVPHKDEWYEDEEPIQIAEFQDQLAADLENMETAAVVPVAGTQSVRMLVDQVRPLNAVITDALARYEYNEHQLMEYMFDVMGVRD